MEEIKKDILLYLDQQIGEFRDDKTLIDYLDSLDMIEMVMWLEKKYEISIPDEDTYNWFDVGGTVNDIVKYIYDRLQNEHPEKITKTKREIKHIRIPNGISKELKGKTIEKTYFNSDLYVESHNVLTIQFTDGDYICVTIDYDEDNYLYDGELFPLSKGNITEYGYLDKNNNFVYYEHYRNLFEMGVLEPIPNDAVRDLILRREKEEEKREYNRYLQLKERFENYNPFEQK
jgi:acyl carrier protein